MLICTYVHGLIIYKNLCTFHMLLSPKLNNQGCFICFVSYNPVTSASIVFFSYIWHF
jgi:hypothetical protein